MKIKLFYICFIVCISILCYSADIEPVEEHSAAVTSPDIPVIYKYNCLINTPTTETLGKGMYRFNFRFYRNGGMYNEGAFSFLPKTMIGYNFRVDNLIGDKYIGFSSPPVDVQAKINILHERNKIPALAIGYNYQGTSLYPEETDKKVYIVTGKTFRNEFNMKGFFGIYISEFVTGTRPRGFIGFYKLLHNDKLGIILEYDDFFNVGLIGQSNVSKFGRVGLGIRFNMTERWIWSIYTTSYYDINNNKFTFDREFQLSYSHKLF